MSQQSNSDWGKKPLVVLIGVIASAMSILAFITGRQSFPELLGVQEVPPAEQAWLEERLPDGQSPAPTRQVMRPDTPTPSVSSLTEHEVVDVIRRFNADQTTAVRNLDLEILRTTCTGGCYSSNRAYMNQLIKDNLYEVQEQLGFEVVSVHVSDNAAMVVTRETWRTAKYDRSTHECRYHQPLFTTQQTYTLVREGTTWKIAEDRFDTPAPADVPGC